jgi:toxin secretion/phage lysis holin
MNTPDKATQIKAALTAVLVFLTALWGWVGWAIIIWITCVVLDYISGTAAARRSGEWSSEIARDGLWHKLGEIFAVLVSALCDIAIGVLLKTASVQLPFDYTTLVTPIVLLWYIITELGSILENAGKLGAPLPKWLKRMLKQYKNALDASQGEDHPPDADPEME